MLLVCLISLDGATVSPDDSHLLSIPAKASDRSDGLPRAGRNVAAAIRLRRMEVLEEGALGQFVHEVIEGFLAFRLMRLDMGFKRENLIS
jgi:hypothetical protein